MSQELVGEIFTIDHFYELNMTWFNHSVTSAEIPRMNKFTLKLILLGTEVISPCIIVGEWSW